MHSEGHPTFGRVPRGQHRPLSPFGRVRRGRHSSGIVLFAYQLVRALYAGGGLSRVTSARFARPRAVHRPYPTWVGSRRASRRWPQSSRRLTSRAQGWGPSPEAPKHGRRKTHPPETAVPGCLPYSKPARGGTEWRRDALTSGPTGGQRWPGYPGRLILVRVPLGGFLSGLLLGLLPRCPSAPAVAMGRRLPRCRA